MSEIGLNINVDSYNNEGIKTIKGNNNAEIYKLYILKNKRRLSLVGKNVKLGYVMAGTTKGDVIENLNITNAEQGEITFPITNRISKQDGVYSCQLAIYGADGFLEHTATFGLTVEANIFTKIAGEIADSKDFTYLENILDKASKLSEKLKENTSTATNANSNLESNITEANNINSKLLENTSTATSLNKNLESNIDLAKEVKETIKDLDTKNIEATEKIQTLTGLNSKATELSNNIQQALPLNSELVKNVESAKTVNNELIATNNDAKAKKTDLDNSLEEAKKYIAGLDGSQNIPQIRLDVDALQNGLKSNQALSYEGSSIVANETLEGRTEGMRICGRTLVNLLKEKIDFISSSNSPHTGQKKLVFATSPNKPFTFIADIKYTGSLPTQLFVRGNKTDSTFVEFGSIEITSNLNGKIVCVCKQNIDKGCSSVLIGFRSNSDNSTIKNAMILEGDWTNKEIPSYFEGLKSFGEAEKVEDKYKISILSRNKNLFNLSKFEDNTIYYQDTGIKGNLNQYKAMRIKTTPNKSYFFTNPNVGTTVQCVAYKNGVRISGGYNWRGMLTKDCDEYVFSFLKSELLSNNFQFEEGTKATHFEPYKEDKKDILIKEPLRSKDDIYDLIYEDDGQVKIDRYVGIRKYQEGDEKNTEVITDKINTVYILDKPIIEIVENCVDIDLDTFQDKTYFSIENSLPGTLDFKVPSNIASIVQSNSKAINELYNLIDTLVLPNILQNTTDIEMLKLEKLK